MDLSKLSLGSPLTLATTAQLTIIKRVRERCAAFEAAYMEAWVEGELSDEHRQLETQLDLREMDTRQVVADFETSQQKPQIQAEDCSKVAARKKKRSSRITKPYSRAKGSKKKSVGVTIVQGIPSNVSSPMDYITYRKCKYIEQVQQWRESLANAMDANSCNALMGTLLALAKKNAGDKEWGLLTTQAAMMNNMVDEFQVAPAKLWLNFSNAHVGGNSASRPVTTRKESKKELLKEMETRMGTTILHFTLSQGVNLTKLILEKCACDSIMKLVSNTAVNLKHLNISGSLVTDEGLLQLCGIDSSCSRPSRESLSRRCKAVANEALYSIVQNQMPTWLKTRIGCEKLEILEAKDMKQMKWPLSVHNGRSSSLSLTTYFHLEKVPLDSGFVTILDHLKQLRALHTEVGARAVAAFQRLNKRRLRRRTKPESNNVESVLSLESLSESELTKSVMNAVAQICPNLKELRVNGNSTFIYNANDWMESTESKCTELASLHISFRQPHLSLGMSLAHKFMSLLKARGQNLTTIFLGEVWNFHYSTLALIKSECPNLVTFNYSMTVDYIFRTFDGVNVEKDADMSCNGQTYKSRLSKLQKVHLSVPFRNEVVVAFLKGCDNIISLTLAVEPQSALNAPQPSECLGKEFLSQLLAENKFSNLKELHLMAVHTIGRKGLNKECLQFVLDKFPELKHLGNLSLWDLSQKDVAEVLAKRTKENRDVTFNEDLRTGLYETNFNYRLVVNRDWLSCSKEPQVHRRWNALSPFALIHDLPFFEEEGFLLDEDEDDDDDFDFDAEDDEDDHEPEPFWLHDDDDDDAFALGLMGEPDYCVVM